MRLATYGLAVILAVSAMNCGGSQDAACPNNVAARLNTGEDLILGDHFLWYQRFGEQILPADSRLVIRLAMIPFDAGDTIIAVTESGGRSAYSFGTFEGKIRGIEYNENDWNIIEAIYEESTQTVTVSVNGSGSIALPTEVSTDVALEGFRIDTSNDVPRPAVAWVDGISVTIESDSSNEIFFAENFDDSPTIDPGIGSVAVEQPSAPLLDAIACSSP